MHESLKKLHTLVGSILLPHVPRGGANYAATAGHQLFASMATVMRASDSASAQQLDQLVDDLRLARATELVDDSFFQQALEYVDQIKQSLGVNDVPAN